MLQTHTVDVHLINFYKYNNDTLTRALVFFLVVKLQTYMTLHMKRPEVNNNYHKKNIWGIIA